MSEIAIENPSSVKIFELLGIDYCCGGKRTLSDSCLRADVDIDHVLDLLANADRNSQTTTSGEWSQEPLRDLIANIVELHHAFVRRETPRIQSLLLKVTAKHGLAHPEISQIEQLFMAIGQELATHMLKEEQVLFPYIERMEQAASEGIPTPPAFFGSVKRPIANMVAEHDDAGALLSRMRELSNQYTAPANACPTLLELYRGLEGFERDLHQHIHLENNILFPRAIEMEPGY